MRPPAVQSSMRQYPGQGATPVNAYVSQPTTAGLHPGVIVIMEIFGLNEHIKGVATPCGIASVGLTSDHPARSRLHQ